MHKKAIMYTVGAVVIGVGVYCYSHGNSKPTSKPININKAAGDVKSGINTAAGKANSAVDSAAGKANVVADTVDKVNKVGK